MCDTSVTCSSPQGLTDQRVWDSACDTPVTKRLKTRKMGEKTAYFCCSSGPDKACRFATKFPAKVDFAGEMCYHARAVKTACAPVAQLDRVSDSDWPKTCIKIA